MQKPLTSLMALGKAGVRTPQDLRGKRVGTAGIPYQSAYLKTILETAGVDPGSVKETNVGFNLVPAMLSGKVDATLGAFWNYEGVDLERRGRDPAIQRMERARRPDLRRARVRRAPARPRRGVRRAGAALHAGDRARARGAARGPGRRRSTGCWRPTRASTAGCRRPSSKATLPVFFPEDAERAVRLPGPGRVAAPTPTGCSTNDLITRARRRAEQALTNEFLAGEGLDPRDALEQD